MNRYTLTTPNGAINLYATTDDEIEALIRSIQTGDFQLARLDTVEQPLPLDPPRSRP